MAFSSCQPWRKNFSLTFLGRGHARVVQNNFRSNYVNRGNYIDKEPNFVVDESQRHLNLSRHWPTRVERPGLGMLGHFPWAVIVLLGRDGSKV